MASKSPELLTPEQRLLFTTIPDDLSTAELTRHYKLTDADLRFILKHRGAENRLGVALQLCTLRFPGRVLMQMSSIPKTMVVFVADQLNLPSDAWYSYGKKRRGTPYEHLQRICLEYEYQLYSHTQIMPLVRYLLPFALENDESLPLVEGAINWLEAYKIVPPAILTTERLVWHVQRIARWRVFRRITNQLDDSQREYLRSILIVNERTKGQTPLGWLDKPPPKPSADGMYHLLDRLAYLRDINLPGRPANVHLTRWRQLAQRGKRYRPQALANLTDHKERESILCAYLFELNKALIDQVLDMFDRWLSDLVRKGRNKQSKYLHQNVKQLNRDLNTLAFAMEAFLEAKQNGTDPFEAVFSIVDEGVLVDTVSSAIATARPSDMDYRDLVETIFVRRRKAMLEMVRSLPFETTSETHSGLTALNHVLDLWDNHDQRVRAEEVEINGQSISTPLDHLKRKRWKRHAITEDGINPNYYELAAFDRLQTGLRAGDVAVTGSQRYQPFDNYLISLNQWEEMKEVGLTRLAVSGEANTYLSERQKMISMLFEQVAEVLNLEDGHLYLGKEGELHLKRLEKVTPDEVKSIGDYLYSFVPEVELSQLIIDVNQWTNVLDDLPHLITQNAASGHQKAALVASLMASGMNIGPTKMAQASDFSEQELIFSAESYFSEDSFRRTIARLDNFVLHHPYSQHWGSGKSSSSDGLRIPVIVNAANSVYNARHFWYRRGVTLVAHAADIWMPFYPQIMKDTSEALYVIDALCHHQTDFDIEEHYTDTASATYHVFALCHMLGFRFAPRIRSVAKQYLYTAEPMVVDDRLKHLLKEPIETHIVVRNWDEMKRMVSSIRHGTVSASLMMKKLASYPKQNELAIAFREMGRLERTVFILEFLLDTALQRRNLRGLNKGEAIWSAAQALNKARDGSMHDRDFDAQMNRASSTMLLVAMISTWNTVYLDKVVNSLKTMGMSVNDDYLVHISPLRWQHINLLGRYEVNVHRTYPLNALRPLRKPI